MREYILNGPAFFHASRFPIFRHQEEKSGRPNGRRRKFKLDMPALPEIAPVLAFLGWPEIVGLLAIILTLYHAKHLPPFIRGLGKGMRHFDEASKEVGESVAGIYGKAAGEALTPDNRTAELYDPAAFRREDEPGKPETSWLSRIWLRIVSFFRHLRS